MFNHCQDFGERIVLTRQANHLGVPGFEKFLFLLLIVFSLFWVLYLRHFAPKAFYVEEIRMFEIELRRYKPEAVPVLHPSVEPDSNEPDSVELDPTKLDAVIPEIEQSPAATGKPEHEEQSVSKKLTQTQLLEEVMELYRAEHPEWREIPDPDAETYRPDNVFDPRLADRIGSIRKENSKRYGGSRRQGDKTFVDNMGGLNYRKGNTCFQIIEIPGIGHQWYSGKCAITQYEMEFEFNGKRY